MSDESQSPGTIEIEGKQYEVTGHDANGVPTIQGHATSVHEKDEDGNHVYDEDGNPKMSVHVSVSPVSQDPVKEGE